MPAIVEAAPAIAAGVDTHVDTHVAAALDGIGSFARGGERGLLEVESFEAGRAGEDKLIAWLCSIDAVVRVAVEGTGSYRAGLGPAPDSGSPSAPGRRRHRWPPRCRGDEIRHEGVAGPAAQAGGTGNPDGGDDAGLAYAARMGALEVERAKQLGQSNRGATTPSPRAAHASTLNGHGHQMATERPSTRQRR